MKTLRESILDIDDNIESQESVYRTKIDEWFKGRVYFKSGFNNLKEYTSYTIDEDKKLINIVDSNITVGIERDTNLNTMEREIGFKFGYVAGDFTCVHNTKIRNLKGSPDKVGKTFNCSLTAGLTSLEGAPRECDAFNCSYCTRLINFNGGPDQVDRIICQGCKFNSFYGFPDSCRSIWFTVARQFTSFAGCPQGIHDITMSDAMHVKDFNDIPNTVNWIEMKHCSLDNSNVEIPKNLELKIMFR